MHAERVVQSPYSTTIPRVAEYLDENHGVLPLTVPLRAFGLPSLFALRRNVIVRFLIARDGTYSSRVADAITISWKPQNGGPMPAFQGRITAHPHNTGVLLALDGAYTPPLRWLGAIFDAAFGRRAAHACADALLIDVQRHLENADLRERDSQAFALHDSNVRTSPAGGPNVPLHGSVSLRRDGSYLAAHITFDGTWDESRFDTIGPGEYRLNEADARIILAAVADSIASDTN